MVIAGYFAGAVAFSGMQYAALVAWVAMFALGFVAAHVERGIERRAIAANRGAF